MKVSLSAVSLALALCACATPETTGYPSLAPRPVEKLGFAEPAAPEAKPVVADPALDAAIAAARAKLASGKTAFDAAADRAGSAARTAKGAAAGSEPWIEAQTRLATLDSLRADTSLVVTDLEQQAIVRATALEPAYPALETLRGEAAAQADDQAKRIATLQAQLAPL
ncbi:conserved exported hypothetical protein [Sphingomonas sp. EC-HK361]|uniref:hypothetical protein n=1 Tax=Sphingomonas sp. EC-HK361 TaxID=2038397 RepID=UPI00125740A0|nr:hypothetical protein [Sphingomonas sp. EC-HK361]VVT10317.1 conserved exported hypothetical protein [Sphingomonas sp. EC-HK361]